MKRKLRLFIVALAVGALVLVIAGCGGGGDKSGAGGGTTGGTDTDVSKLADNQTLTISWGAEPPSLDPGLATDTTSSNVLLNIMDPLVQARTRRPQAGAEPGEELGRQRQGRDLPPARRRQAGRTAIR